MRVYSFVLRVYSCHEHTLVMRILLSCRYVPRAVTRHSINLQAEAPLVYPWCSARPPATINGRFIRTGRCIKIKCINMAVYLCTGSGGTRIKKPRALGRHGCPDSQSLLKVRSPCFSGPPRLPLSARNLSSSGTVWAYDSNVLMPSTTHVASDSWFFLFERRLSSR